MRREGAFAFSRSHRLLRRPDFLRCYDRGRRHFSRNFVFFVLRDPARSGPWRLGLAVTRKSGNAVRRNRIKRIVRECFRLRGRDIPPCLDIVVVPKRCLEPGTLTLAGLTREFLPILRAWRVHSDEASVAEI